jgi:hypothetical protein
VSDTASGQADGCRTGDHLGLIRELLSLIDGSTFAVRARDAETADREFRFVFEPREGIERRFGHAYLAVWKILITCETAQHPSRHRNLSRDEAT